MDDAIAKLELLGPYEARQADDLKEQKDKALANLIAVLRDLGKELGIDTVVRLPMSIENQIKEAERLLKEGEPIPF